MTVSLKHTFQSAKTDSADVTIVQPSNWNEEHELTLATNKLLGRATAGTGAAEELSIGTALSISGGTLAVTTVPVANGGTGSTTLTANNVLLGNGTSAVQTVAPGASGNALISDGTTWTSAVPSSPVAYPQNIQSADYTLVLGDAGKQIFHPASDAIVRQYTIPANASVAFPIGTVVLFTVENGGTTVGVAINSDTLIFGDGTTGSIGVVANQTLMAIKVTATKWMANYLYQTGTPTPYNAGSSIAVGHVTFPSTSAYPWNSGTGFGTKYADPATALSAQANGIAFNPSTTAIAMAITGTPYVNAYVWSGLGFGTKYSNPATLPTGVGYGIKFSPAGDAVAVAHDTTPFVTAYPWSVSGFGTKYANPATLPVGAGLGVSFNPAGDTIAISHITTPFISVYPWNSSTGFGTKYTNPATLPTGSCTGVAFSPAGNAIAVSHDTTPFVTAYPWSGAGFGTKYANPATLPSGNGKGVTFNPSATAIAVTATPSPYIQVYLWDGSTGFGTKYANPATLPTGAPQLSQNVAFNADGSSLAVAHSTTPFVTAYPWSGAGFGTKYSNPATLPTGTGYAVAFTSL